MKDRSVEVKGKAPANGRAIKRGAIAVIAACGLAVHLHSRPRWQPPTVPGDFMGTTIVVECPDDWVPYNGNDYAQFVPIRHLELHPKPMTGLALWWHTRKPSHRPDLPAHGMNDISIKVNALPASWHKSHPQWLLENQERDYREPCDIVGLYDSTRRTQHLLGPALAVSEDRTQFEPDMPGNIPFKPQHTESLFIYPAHHTDDEIGHIEIVCSAPASEYPRLKPLFDKVMQSVRLARK